MDVETVTTSDRSLLKAVRGTLEGADEAILCVAFVQQRGVHLVEKELEALAARKAPARLVVTTTFDTTTQAALGLAHGLAFGCGSSTPARAAPSIQRSTSAAAAESLEP